MYLAAFLSLYIGAADGSEIANLKQKFDQLEECETAMVDLKKHLSLLSGVNYVISCKEELVPEE
jgi:hypothetical protein